VPFWFDLGLTPFLGKSAPISETVKAGLTSAVDAWYYFLRSLNPEVSRRRNRGLMAVVLREVIETLVHER
jgi:hypothetical protein